MVGGLAVKTKQKQSNLPRAAPGSLTDVITAIAGDQITSHNRRRIWRDFPRGASFARTQNTRPTELWRLVPRFQKAAEDNV